MTGLSAADCHFGTLALAEVPDLGWSGDRAHLDAIRRTVATDEYLAVRDPAGMAVSIGAIDWRAHPRSGYIHQVVTHPALRGRGIGTALIVELQRRISARGCTWVMLAVEDENPRARALYERLGYASWGRGTDSWQVIDPDGSERTHLAPVTYLRRPC